MPLPLAYWVDNLSPFLGPHWGNFGIRYYGSPTCWASSSRLAARALCAGRPRSQLPAAQVEGFIVAVVVGRVPRWPARFLLPLRWLADVSHRPVVHLSRSGKAAWRVTADSIGVAIAVAWYAHRSKISFFHLGDLIVSTRARRIAVRPYRQLHQRRALGQGDHGAVGGVIFPRSMPRARAPYDHAAPPLAVV